MGDIYDETDTAPRAVTRLPDGSLRLPGTFPVHELPELDVHLTDRPAGDYVTVAGMLLAQLGHIPEKPGEQVVLGSWTATVAAVNGRAITEVVLSPHTTPE